MRFWTTVSLKDLPVVFGTGLDDRHLGGFMVYNDPEPLAESFARAQGDLDEKGDLEDESDESEEPEEPEEFDEDDEDDDSYEEDEDYRYIAFLTFDIPDKEVDDWLTVCMEHYSAIWSDLEGDLESAIENEDSQEEIDALSESVALLQDMDSGTKSLSFFGHACLNRVIEPYMISLIDPTTMTEAIYTGERVQIETALWNGEATSLLSLNPAFWAWLMMLLGQILTGGGGSSQTAEERDTAAASRKAAARRARRRRSGRGKKKKRSGALKGSVTA